MADQRPFAPGVRGPSDSCAGPGWWQASDGKWYPPEARVPLEPAEPTATARRTPGVWWWAAWLALLVAWVPPLVAMHVADSSPAAKTGVGAGLGTVAVLATLVFGARLGQRSAWREVWVASVVGAGEIAVAVFCWELLAPTDPESTQTGGLLVMGFVLAFYAVGGLLVVGAAIGQWLQRVRAAR